METLDIDNEIKHYEQKLRQTSNEYFSSKICQWNAIRERENYFRREIYRLNQIKREREIKSKYFSVPTMKYEAMSKQIENKNNKVQRELESKYSKTSVMTKKQEVELNNINTESVVSEPG